MRIQSGRAVGMVWVGAFLIFLASARASTALHPPAGTVVTRPGASYYVGLVGLVAIGIALWLTWGWTRRGGPASGSARAALRGLLGVVTVLWFAAMVLPFL